MAHATDSDSSSQATLTDAEPGRSERSSTTAADAVAAPLTSTATVTYEPCLT